MTGICHAKLSLYPSAEYNLAYLDIASILKYRYMLAHQCRRNPQRLAQLSEIDHAGRLQCHRYGESGGSRKRLIPASQLDSII